MKVAFRIYPLPNGKTYTEEDVKTLKDVEELFDYCQIYEATISNEGWNFLIDTFGIEGLYKADKQSGWFNSGSLEEFVCDMESERNTNL